MISYVLARLYPFRLFRMSMIIANVFLGRFSTLLPFPLPGQFKFQLPLHAHREHTSADAYLSLKHKYSLATHNRLEVRRKLHHDSNVNIHTENWKRKEENKEEHTTPFRSRIVRDCEMYVPDFLEHAGNFRSIRTSHSFT